MNSDPLFLVMVGYGAMVVFMLVLWGVQVVHRNASIADVGFCAGLIVVVLWYARVGFGDPERKLFVAVMVCVYAGRLGLFLLFNRVIGTAEDARYQEMRRSWGGSEQARMFGYFQLQAAAVAAFSLPFLVRPLPTGNWRGFGHGHGIMIGSAGMVSGITRATRIISSNGFTGGVMS
jgi:steroid 5-alpha reductase family enzyme